MSYILHMFNTSFLVQLASTNSFANIKYNYVKRIKHFTKYRFNCLDRRRQEPFKDLVLGSCRFLGSCQEMWQKLAAMNKGTPYWVWAKRH